MVARQLGRVGCRLVQGMKWLVGLGRAENRGGEGRAPQSGVLGASSPRLLPP